MYIPMPLANSRAVVFDRFFSVNESTQGKCYHIWLGRNSEYRIFELFYRFGANYITSDYKGFMGQSDGTTQGFRNSFHIESFVLHNNIQSKFDCLFMF